MILIFEHEGWTVVTSSWTAGSKDGNKVVICYEWGADRFSWFDNSVSTARVTFELNMAQFIEATKHGNFIDLRPKV